MAEHRRVEPRGIIGTGMATDPERLRTIEEEHERHRRAWRNAPEIEGRPTFGDVLSVTPPWEPSPEAEPPRPARRPATKTDTATIDADPEPEPNASPDPNAEGGAEAPDTPESGAALGAVAQGRRAKADRVRRLDPRADELRKAVEARLASGGSNRKKARPAAVEIPGAAPTHETPPTGKIRVRRDP
jgi:hypothetical protein